MSSWEVAIAPDGTWLATVGEGLVRIWDAVTGEQRATLADRAGRLRAIAIAPNGTWLTAIGDNGLVRILDPVTWEQRATLVGHTGLVRAAAITSNGAWLATVGADRSVRIWDPATGSCAAVMRVDGDIHACAWSPSGHLLAAIGSAGLYFFAFKP